MAPTLNIVLKNNTDSPALYAHVTGRDDQGVVMMQADGKTAFHPASPAETLQPPGADCSIAVGGPGESRTVTIPYLSGARIWFCKGKPLTFLINPGPAVVEPSATNPSDPNYELDWGFCEFTWNTEQVYVNVSYVDFVSLPISLQLENEGGVKRTVPGLPKGALDAVCDKLQKQGGGWDKLVVKGPSGQNMRALSPNAGMVLYPDLFQGYYQSHVDAVWAKYAKEDLTVNTQFTWGDAVGRVNGDGKLDFGSAGAFAKPAARDIFSCSTGPFAHEADTTEEKLNIGARLAAALNRSTLLINSKQPEGEKVDTYYKEAITNHYSRICHEVSIEGRGYAFPYDDVSSSSGEDQSGYLNDPKPKELTVVVGGPSS